MSSERPISAKEAGEMLGVSSRTVINMAERGELPGFRVGILWRFRPSDIRAYIERQIEQRREKQEEEKDTDD
jgi:excisionase family DNA binding protein